MKVLIVDDQLISRTVLKQLISKVDDIELVGECSSALEALQFLKRTQVELILLDIEMPEMTGIEMIKCLDKQRPFIVFTTAKKEYAVDAFELNVVDYLVKPILPVRFFQSIEKLRELMQQKHDEIKVEPNEFLFIRDSNVIRRLRTDDILFAEAMGDYVKLYTNLKYFAIHITLKSLEDKLPESIFLRVHRSYIVSLSKIDTLEDGVLVINKKVIPIADSYRAALNKRLNVL